MKPLIHFLLFVIVSLFLAALLSWPLYLGLDYVARLLGNGHIIRFRKVVSRTTLIILLLGLWWFLKSLSLDNHQSLGYSWPQRRFWYGVLNGWFFGLVTLLVLVAQLILLGAREWRIAAAPGAADVFVLFLKALIGGLLIGFIEETFFRGALYSAMRRNWHVLSTVLFTAALYSAVHFLRSSLDIAYADVHWSSGLTELASAFTGFSQRVSVDGFLALLAVGVLLAVLRQRSNSIALCIGVHAGWIFVIKFTRHFTLVQPESPWSFLVSSYDGVTGYIAMVWIGLLTVLIWRSVLLRSATPRVRA